MESKRTFIRSDNNLSPFSNSSSHESSSDSFGTDKDSADDVSDESCSLSFVSSLGSQESQSVSGDENSLVDQVTE